ncbi:peptide-methionine (S)-S-oxide reductase [Pseudoxanthomonas kalamensis DSM 18571]|uniref:peptide-methionine (S)-S-oxide reductase MsrA n=1 Tax=Pseudoxanthomonas kalamensis TaxID=289483 RepID=UPI001390D6E2|nr:peptide-methionine (S)-S-oxide reductase MsrA [Pseudoxanthomonas kalamensis]KAF1709334.1 peptide-methionine (S)-S-oxide reductase [Pseudoxanthomonas kalamensis DSM 18571]
MSNVSTTMTRGRGWRYLIGGLIALSALLVWQCSGHGADRDDGKMAATPMAVVPAPELDEAVGKPGNQVAIFAGGCFWGVQGVFQHVRGVKQVMSGYAGGNASHARYEMVSSGRTGHAESVYITYDPAEVSYGTLLRIFFGVVHDPTELNRQGPDVGTQYRSAIFPTTPTQSRVAHAYIEQLDAAKYFPRPLATNVEKYTAFYPAEDYHQDYMTRNPHSPYIMFHDAPKLRQLQKVFPQYYRDAPVLVNPAG